MGELVVSPADSGPPSFHSWLSTNPRADRARDLKKSRRIVNGLKKWPLSWLKKTGVVCYERADGRIRRERGGKADGAFLRGVVKTVELPTATANASDHYVVLSPNKEPRFMTVEEVMRAYGIPAGSDLWRSLLAPKGVVSAPQAVSCLGRGVHVGVAHRIMVTLLEGGKLTLPLAYGSAFSGIDTFASAVDKATGGLWTYEFASEPDPIARRALLKAWSRHGLSELGCFRNACSLEACTAPPVDLFVCTPECDAHSKRNHSRNAADQRVSLEDLWKSLEYVRLQKPTVVVVENVNEPSSIGPITGLLARLEGYRLESAMLDPRGVAKMPIARERRFWVLYLE